MFSPWTFSARPWSCKTAISRRIVSVGNSQSPCQEAHRCLTLGMNDLAYSRRDALQVHPPTNCSTFTCSAGVQSPLPIPFRPGLSQYDDREHWIDHCSGRHDFAANSAGFALLILGLFVSTFSRPGSSRKRSKRLPRLVGATTTLMPLARMRSRCTAGVRVIHDDDVELRQRTEAVQGAAVEFGVVGQQDTRRGRSRTSPSWCPPFPGTGGTGCRR